MSDNNVTDYVELGLTLNDYNLLIGISANLIGFTFMLTSLLVISYIGRK